MLGTTDLHGSVFNWDYFKNAEYDDSAHNDIGLAKVATLVNRSRADNGSRATLLLIDAGDTIQGTSLAYYYAKIEPISERRRAPDGDRDERHRLRRRRARQPRVQLRHPHLRTFEKQLDFPLLGANALDPATGRPAFPPYVIKTVRPPHGRRSRSASSA